MEDDNIGMPDLSTLLKRTTAPIHERLDGLPLFRALQAGALPPLPIVNLLRSFAIIHGVLDRALTTTTDADVSALGRAVLPKIPLLVADLDLLGADTVPSIRPAIDEAIECAAGILARSDDPLTLLGALYVVEGAQNGGLALRQAYADCLGMPAEQLSFFGCYGRGTAAHWTGFRARLDAVTVEPGEANLVVSAAVACFDGLESVCAALHPHADTDLGYHVSGINFEAGDHAMPQDPRDIALALRVGREAWEAYPYLERRFGDRGKRFTRSDSCWLVALTRMPVDTATKNLQWLRTVLSSRGIPTVILEGHLRAIARALATERPEQIDASRTFERFLSGLEAERSAAAVGAREWTVVGEFDRRLRHSAGPAVDAAASLIASAWLDERIGIRGALAATRDWFTDASRFSDEWIAHIHELVATLERSGSSC